VQRVATMAHADILQGGETSIFDLLTQEVSTLNRGRVHSHAETLSAAGAAPLLRDDSSAGNKAQPPGTPAQRRLANAAFCLLGIGVAIAWTLLRAGIAYFDERFPLGATFYTLLQVAYNVPCLPLLVAQLCLDEKYDVKYGSTRAYSFRFLVSMVVMAGCMMIVPYGGQASTLVGGVLVGVFDAVCFGTAAQFFAVWPEPRVASYYFIGASLTSIISIALTFATGFDAPNPPQASVTGMYAAGSVIVLAGLGAALYLVRSPLGRQCLDEKDDAARRALVRERMTQAAAAVEASDRYAIRDEEPLVTMPVAGGSGGAASSSSSSSSPWSSWLGMGGSTGTILRQTALCHVALFFCWWSTNWVDSLIAFVPSQQDTPQATYKPFRLIILYCSLLGELAGKQLNIARRGRCIKGPRMLLVAVLARFALVVLYLLFILQPTYTPDGRYHVRLDWLSAAYQALHDMSGAYLSTLTYSLAPGMLTDASQRATSSTLLSITLTLGLYTGLGCSVGTAQVLSALPASALQQ